MTTKRNLEGEEVSVSVTEEPKPEANREEITGIWSSFGDPKG